MSEAKVAQLEAILRKSGSDGGRHFSEKELHRLLLYYQLVLKWNDRLHLTTLTQPEQFFQRHIFESAMAEAYLISAISQLWDLGSGLGVPGVPIAILRPNLQVYLVEASRNKVIFLKEVVAAIELVNARVVGSRIEALDALPKDSCLTARAVEKMGQLLTEMVRIGKTGTQMLILGTEPTKRMVESMLASDWLVQAHPITGTERELIINAIRFT